MVFHDRDQPLGNYTKNGRKFRKSLARYLTPAQLLVPDVKSTEIIDGLVGSIIENSPPLLGIKVGPLDAPAHEKLHDICCSAKYTSCSPNW